MAHNCKPNICPVCDSDQLNQLFHCKDHLVSKDLFAIAECPKCGVRITMDVPCEAEIGHYYQSDDYVSHTDNAIGIVNKLYYLVRKKMIAKKANWVARSGAKNGGRLLDFGCGTGYFSAEMKSRGWNVVAVEKSDEARAVAKDNFGIDAHSSLNDFLASNGDNKVDAITLWHVLEHIEPINETLAAFASILNQDGRLIIAVPNFQSLDASIHKEQWAAYDVPRHLWHFSAPQMHQLAARHNLQIVQTKTMPFDAFYISMLSYKNNHKTLPTLRGFCIGTITWFLSLFNPHKSSSLVYILKKI